MKTLQKFLNYAREHEIAQVDLKFTDLFGGLHHVTVPLSRVDEGFLAQGWLSTVPAFPDSLRLSAATCSCVWICDGVPGPICQGSYCCSLL